MHEKTRELITLMIGEQEERIEDCVKDALKLGEDLLLTKNPEAVARIEWLIRQYEDQLQGLKDIIKMEEEHDPKT